MLVTLIEFKVMYFQVFDYGPHKKIAAVAGI